MSGNDNNVTTFTQRSKGYLIFLTIFLGLIAQLDQYLNLVETSISQRILTEYSMSLQDFLFWQGIYGLITMLVFFLNWGMDAFGRKKGLIILVLFMGIPALMIPLVNPTFHLFMLLYAIVIMGTLSNAWEIPMSEEAPPKSRGKYGSLVFLIGLIPLYALIGDDIAEAWGWRWCYGIMAILMVVILALMFWFREPERWEKSKLKRGRSRFNLIASLKCLTRKDVVYILVATLVYGLWNISFKMATTANQPYVMSFGYSFDQYQTFLTIGGLMTMVAAIVGAFALDRFGRNKVMLIGCVGATISYILFGTIGKAGVPIAMIMVFFFMPIILVWILVYFAEIFPTDVRGTSVGMLNIGSRLSYVAGPLLGFALLAAGLDYTGYYIIAGLFLLVPLLALLLKPYETKCKTLEEIECER